MAEEDLRVTGSGECQWLFQGLHFLLSDFGPSDVLNDSSDIETSETQADVLQG